MNEEVYIELKSKMLHSCFSVPPAQGMSENEFVDLLRNKVLTGLAFEPTFLNDVKINGKSMLDYYSSTETPENEKMYFSKTFNDLDVLNCFQFNKFHFFDFVSNVAKGAAENKSQIYNEQLKLTMKIIEIEWSRDIDTLLIEKYQGNNVLAHILSHGVAASTLLFNQSLKSKLTTKVLNEKKVNFLKDHTKSELVFNNLYFDLMYYSFSKHPENSTTLAIDNKSIINSNLMINSAEISKVVDRAFTLYENDRIEYIMGDFKVEKSNRKIRI